MRRTSVSLPTNKIVHDPHEKPARYGALPRRAGVWDTLMFWMAQAKQTRWLKTAALVLAVFSLFYYFSPSGVDLYHEGERCGTRAPFLVRTRLLTDHCVAHSVSSNVGGGQTPSDSSYGTDSCIRSASRDKPIVQYVLMIDAGSTGSRIHVYKFNNCGATPELESEVFRQTKKMEGGSSGLSAYPDDPQGAARSLDQLMDEAMRVVPDKLKACTPIAVKATAGLRLLGPEKSQKILDAVRDHLEKDYPFPVVSREDNGVAIMDGSDEGVYAWITTNYLLGNIGAPEHDETAAVFDLGGGSTQIVFEPNFKGLTHGGMPREAGRGRPQVRPRLRRPPLHPVPALAPGLRP